MSRTLRRRPWSWVTGPQRWDKVGREKTCKPGCAVCSKDPEHRRREKVRRRQKDQVEIRLGLE